MRRERMKREGGKREKRASGERRGRKRGEGGKRRQEIRRGRRAFHNVRACGIQ